MAYRTGFFDAIDGDRTYGAADMSHYYEGLISDGILANFAQGCKVIANNDMTVSITPGKAYINGRYIQIDSNEVLTLEQASSSLNRIDAIVLRFDNSQAVRNIVPTIKKGEPATSPLIPVIEKTSEVKEICLATVYVKALATSFTDAYVTDQRPNTTLCGFVTGLITQVDTADLFIQWETAYNTYYKNSTENFTAWSEEKKQNFETWYKTLTGELSVGASLVRYNQKNKIVENIVNGFVIPVEYEKGDLVDVNVNGLKLMSDEFEITEENNGGGNVTGRNLLRNSSFINGITSWMGANGTTVGLVNQGGRTVIKVDPSTSSMESGFVYQTISNVELDTMYTIEVDVYVETPKDVILVTFYLNNGWHKIDTKRFPVTTGWNKIHFTFKSDPIINNIITSIGGLKGEIIYAYHPCLTKGTEARGWSPAPEDTNTRISIPGNLKYGTDVEITFTKTEIGLQPLNNP